MHISKDAALVQDKEIQKLKERAAKYGRLKAALYQDLKEGLISEAQFDRVRNQYTDREIGLQKAIQEQKALVEKIYKNGIAAESILRQFKENPQVDELNHRLLVSLTNRIVVYEDNTVEIIYRYTDEMKKCEQYCIQYREEENMARTKNRFNVVDKPRKEIVQTNETWRTGLYARLSVELINRKSESIKINSSGAKSVRDWKT